MKVIKRSEICASAPKLWAEQYARDASPEQVDITRRLANLAPDELTPQRINLIIGNGSWTSNECDACGKDCEELVRIGQEPDYDARWIDICASCLGEAVALLTPHTSHKGE